MTTEGVVDPNEDEVFIRSSLGEKVDKLTQRVTIAQTVAERLRNVVIALAMMMLILGCSLYWLWNVAQDAKDTSKAVKDSQIVACQNNNEQREKTRALWSFVLAASARPKPGDVQTPEEAAFAKKFGDWVNQLYAERDCSEPNKVIEIPAPPSLK